MARLAGKVVVLSGTAPGMRRSAALRFAAEGAIVAGGDRLEDTARETLDLIEADRGTGSSARLDVTDEVCVRAWVREAAVRFGRTHVLYANAGAVRFCAAYINGANLLINAGCWSVLPGGQATSEET